VPGSDSAEGLHHLDAGIEPALIISDFRLPGMNGIDFISEARKRLRADIPAIIMTGDTGSQHAESVTLPHCHVVYKPVETERMLELIHDIVAERQRLHDESLAP
jgi:DNA-binding NtrC family response regulator